jgi:hypothetical protein
MSELRKRWTRGAIGYDSWVLKETDRDWNRAHILRRGTEWELRVWEDVDWGKPIDVKTLRTAKALGRILATTATNI